MLDGVNSAAMMSNHPPGRPQCKPAAVAVLAVFPMYFQQANTSFARGAIASADVARELERWATWHWGRTLLAIGAFACALLAL